MPYFQTLVEPHVPKNVRQSLVNLTLDLDYLKVPSMPGLMAPMPFKTETAFESSVPDPLYGPLRQQHTHAAPICMLPHPPISNSHDSMLAAFLQHRADISCLCFFPIWLGELTPPEFLSCSAAGNLPVEEMAASNLVPVRGSGTYDASQIAYPAQVIILALQISYPR